MAVQILDHTADVALWLRGAPSVEVLFVEATWGFYQLVLGLSQEELEGRKPQDARTLSFRASDYEGLLVAYLSELLYFLEVHHEVVVRPKALSLTAQSLEVKAGMAHLEGLSQKIVTPIKAVTFSGLRIEKTEKGFSARIVFDI